MPEHVSIYIARHPSNTSNEVAREEAMAGDRALQALGFDLVGGAYANEDDAVKVALRAILGDED